MKKRIWLIGLLCLSFAFPASAGKLLPPPQLMTIFNDVIEVEDAVGEKEWEDALRVVDEINDLLAEISSSIRSAAGDGVYQELSGSVVQLRSVLERTDADAVSKALVDMQKRIFKTMDYYEYAVHPSFVVLQNYVAEALEAGEKADFERVVHEMKEVATVMAVSATVMGEKGVGKGMRQDFLDQLFVVMGAATEKNQQATLAALQKLERLCGAFVWLGQQ